MSNRVFNGLLYTFVIIVLLMYVFGVGFLIAFLGFRGGEAVLIGAVMGFLGGVGAGLTEA